MFRMLILIALGLVCLCTDTEETAEYFDGVIGGGLVFPAELPYASGLDILDTSCGHNIDHSTHSPGYNHVLKSDGTRRVATGMPFQEGDYLSLVGTYVDDANERNYAQIFAFMGQIRDALICDLTGIDWEMWVNLTYVLTNNSIKLDQDISSQFPNERYYNTSGIFFHLKDGDDHNSMMKYVEEAELSMKCLGFTEPFNFINPEGHDGCLSKAVTVTSVKRFLLLLLGCVIFLIL